MSKQALISPNEVRESGYRVAEVVNDGHTFPVGTPMFWTPCPDNVLADQFWYDPQNELFIAYPANIDFIKFTGKTAELTTCWNHNLDTGTSITLTDQEPADYSGTYTITVISPLKFTYEMATEPSGIANIVGKYTVNN